MSYIKYHLFISTIEKKTQAHKLTYTVEKKSHLYTKCSHLLYKQKYQRHLILNCLFILIKKFIAAFLFQPIKPTNILC